MTRERGACPDPLMLSAYLDGTLDATDSGRIEDHISRCEDCYFVVREAALALRELETSASDPGLSAPATSSPTSVTPSPSPRVRSIHLNRYALPLAAALVIAAGAVALWRMPRDSKSYADSISPLVQAVGDRRFFEARLTGGFKFGPTVASRRSPGSGPPSEAWAMLALASEMRGAHPAPAALAERGSRAAAALFLGEVDEAVSEYSELVRAEPSSARWSSDLAAALLVRASRGAGDADRDRAEALAHAEQALRLDPSLAEAGFNRGLALKALGRIDEARRAFTEMAARGDAWSAAARDELR